MQIDYNAEADTLHVAKDKFKAAIGEFDGDGTGVLWHRDFNDDQLCGACVFRYRELWYLTAKRSDLAEILSDKLGLDFQDVIKQLPIFTEEYRPPSKE